MEEIVLKDFETFDEFPNKYLMINNDSNYYYIAKEEQNFITRRNIDSISNIIIGVKEKVLVKISYIDVISGNLIHKTEFISDINSETKDFIKYKERVKIISLNTILNVKGNSVYYLSKQDIDILIDYKEENSKTYNLSSKKNYF